MSAARDIEDVASRYILRREAEEWSETDQAELEAWLSASMAHRAAYLRLKHGWAQADRLAALRSQGVTQRQPAWWRRRDSLLAIAAVSTGILALSVPFMRGALEQGFADVAEAAYATPVGGFKTVTLADGSHVELNTSTQLRTEVTHDRREVWLKRGEAFFKVTPDAGRPFIVHAGNRKITVLGTSFSVRLDGDEVSVSVVEGKVRLEAVGAPATAPTETVPPTLTRGELAVARGSEILIATDAAARVDRDLAWRHGMLSFDQAALADVVGEFNRYNVRQIVVEDPAVASIRIGGTFKSSNTDAFLRLLQSAYGLHVAEDGEKITVSG